MVIENIKDQRSFRNCLYAVCLRITRSWKFTTFICIAIIANTFVLGLDKYPQSEEEEKSLEYINHGFLVIFFIEFVIKLLGIGWALYKRDSANLFDLLLMFIAAVEIVFMNLNIKLKVMQTFRILRLLRIFKLARVWSNLNSILKTMWSTFKSIGYFYLLLSLFLLMFTVLGMEVFGRKARFDEYNNPISEDDKEAFEDGIVPLWNFDTFWAASITVFITLANDGWITIYLDYYRAVGGAEASVFFLSVIIIG